MNAQQSMWISEEAKEILAVIYKGDVGGFYDPDAYLIINERINGAEKHYINAYRYFISYQAYENQHDYDAFFSCVKEFEAVRSGERLTDQYITINLAVQEGLMYLMKGYEFEGAMALYKGYRILRRVEAGELDAEYRKLSALFDIFVSQVESYNGFFSSLLGLKGDVQKGFEKLDKYVNSVKNQTGIYEEALLLKAFCQLKFGSATSEDIYGYSIYGLENDVPLLSYVALSLALKERDGDSASLFVQKLPESQFKSFPILYYLKGRILMNSLDTNALNLFKLFRHYFNGNSFKADGYFREARWYHLNHEPVKRDKAIDMVIDQASSSISSDKQAKDEVLKLKNKPVEFVKARFLFDGGFYYEAKEILESYPYNEYNNYYRLEYHYRIGRICKEIWEYECALKHFDACIGLSKYDDRYFGPYAAVEAAYICKQKGEFSKMNSYLEIAKELNTGQYKPEVKYRIRDIYKEAE